METRELKNKLMEIFNDPMQVNELSDDDFDRALVIFEFYDISYYPLTTQACKRLSDKQFNRIVDGVTTSPFGPTPKNILNALKYPLACERLTTEQLKTAIKFYPEVVKKFDFGRMSFPSDVSSSAEPSMTRFQIIYRNPVLGGGDKKMFVNAVDSEEAISSLVSKKWIESIGADSKDISCQESWLHDELAYKKVFGISSHESDLYVTVSPASRAILAQYPVQKKNATIFTDSEGVSCYDIPFAYKPFYDKFDKKAWRNNRSGCSNEVKLSHDSLAGCESELPAPINM